MQNIEKVQIETVHACNGKCRICNWKDDAGPYSEMEGKVFFSIVSQIKELPNLKTVCLYGHNEPLLDPLIWDRCRYVRKSIPNVRIELSTNGLLMDERKMYSFILNVDDRWISFHGVGKESYEKNMGLPWVIGLKVRDLIKSNPFSQFCISTALLPEYTKDEIKEFWKDYHNVKLILFPPRDRCGNIQSDVCLSFFNKQKKDFDCWRFNLFLCYNTKGYLIPCSNDLQERHRYGTYRMTLNELMDERSMFKLMNQFGAETICGRCEDHGR